jgi:hypothetical protein
VAGYDSKREHGIITKRDITEKDDDERSLLNISVPTDQSTFFQSFTFFSSSL